MGGVYSGERCLGTPVCGPTLKGKVLAPHQKISELLYIYRFSVGIKC